MLATVASDSAVPLRCAQVAPDQRQLGAVHGHVGAGAHRDADIGACQRRRIVDAVAAIATTRPRLAASRRASVCRRFDFAVHFVDAQALADGARRGHAVAGAMTTRRPALRSDSSAAGSLP